MLLYSPASNLERSEMEMLERAKVSVDVAMYSFTDRELAEELGRLARSGVRVRVYRDSVQYQQESQHGLSHVAGLAADECLVCLDLSAVTANLEQRSILHSEPDAMEHEPCRLLNNPKRAGNLARRNSIFRTGDDPHGRKPLIESKRGVFENGSDLYGELLPCVLGLALSKPVSGDEFNFLAPAGGTDNALRPTLSREECEAFIGIGEVDNGFLKCTRLFIKNE